MGRYEHDPLDLRLGKLAGEQHRVVDLEQLKDLGLGERGVRHRVARGRLYRIFPAVYAVGSPDLSGHGRWMAAVLACGAGTVLSHRDGGALLGVRPNHRWRIEVTTPTQAGRRIKQIQTHHGKLHPDDVTEVDRIPVTSVARTLLDLAEVVDRPGLERAIERADQLGVFDLRAVDAVLKRAIGRHGAPKLEAALRREPDMTNEELERRFLALCRRAKVPLPEVNRLEGGKQVDFRWPLYRLIVETDGWSTHRSRRAFQRDRARDRQLVIAGWRVVRFTWYDVVHNAGEVVAQLRALLQPPLEAE